MRSTPPAGRARRGKVGRRCRADRLVALSPCGRALCIKPARPLSRLGTANTVFGVLNSGRFAGGLRRIPSSPLRFPGTMLRHSWHQADRRAGLCTTGNSQSHSEFTINTIAGRSRLGTVLANKSLPNSSAATERQVPLSPRNPQQFFLRGHDQSCHRDAYAYHRYEAVRYGISAGLHRFDAS